MARPNVYRFMDRRNSGRETMLIDIRNLTTDDLRLKLNQLCERGWQVVSASTFLEEGAKGTNPAGMYIMLERLNGLDTEMPVWLAPGSAIVDTSGLPDRGASND